MLATIYWLLAILLMLILLVNAIMTFVMQRKNDKEYQKLLKRQNNIIEKEMRDLFLRDLREINKLVTSLKEDK